MKIFYATDSKGNIYSLESIDSDEAKAYAYYHGLCFCGDDVPRENNTLTGGETNVCNI